MLARVLAAPPVLLALFGLVLFTEVLTFAVLLQWAAFLRIVLLLALMAFTLNGSRIARYCLIILLFAGGAFLFLGALRSKESFWFVFAFHYLPTTMLLITAYYVLLAPELDRFLSVHSDGAPAGTGPDSQASIERLAIALNLIALAFFVVAVLIMIFSNQASSVLPFLNLLPFALALIALRPESKRWGAWFALAVNVLYSTALVGVATFALAGDTLAPMLVMTFCLALAVPCALNAKVLLGRLRPSL